MKSRLAVRDGYDNLHKWGSRVPVGISRQRTWRNLRKMRVS
jgi:hypothetical protein